MFKEYINNNLNSIYDFNTNWYTCPDYVFETSEIKDCINAKIRM